MSRFKVIGTGPNRDQGTITHNKHVYEPGDDFPGEGDTASEADIAMLLKSGQLATEELLAALERARKLEEIRATITDAQLAELLAPKPEAAEQPLADATRRGKQR